MQVCWEKFTRYFEVEERFVPLKEGQYTLTADQVCELVDENTIGVAAILGSTYTGEFDDIKLLNDKLTALNQERGLDVRIHVDGASGAFVGKGSESNKEIKGSSSSLMQSHCRYVSHLHLLTSNPSLFFFFWDSAFPLP